MLWLRLFLNRACWLGYVLRSIVEVAGMSSIGFALSVLGKHGPLLLVLALAAGAVWQDLANWAHDLLPVSAFLLTLGSFLTASLAPPEEALGRVRLLLALAWVGFGVPLLIAGLLIPLQLDPTLRAGVILSVVAPPVGSAAALATMLNLRPRLALLTSIALTIAAPAVMPLLATWLGAEVSLNVGQLAWRLLLIVGSAALLSAFVRRWRPRFTGILPDALAAAGVAVIGLVIVGLAVTYGVRAQLAAAPHEFAAYVTAAVGVNLGIGLVASVLFAQWGTRYAFTVALVSGNRNVTLAWAATGTTLAAPSEAYIAACVIPVLSLPLVLKGAFAMRTRAIRFRSTA
jgi:arsenite transporter